jgi:biopolymer transport protein ExbD
MLVLLIIFLITVPVATASIGVELPQERTEQRQVKPGTLTVSVDREGRLHLDRRLMADGPSLLRELVALGDTDRPVHVVADLNARYGQIEPALQAVRQAGMKQVSFVTDPGQR